MSRGRGCFFGLGLALLFSALGACHDSSGVQLAPTPNVMLAPSAAPASSAPPTTSAAEQTASARPGVATPLSPAPAPAGSAEISLSNEASVASSAGAGTNPTGESAPLLLDAQGRPLAQTDERPTLTSASFQKRVELVARAIITGHSEPASAAFFPLLAYQQVKDVAKPERDYKLRLLANFTRDVDEYHRALGASASTAKFEGIAVSEKDAKWMAPGSEGNRVGYFRVLRSRLRFTLPTGRTRDFELTSMISWRGEWYVVHLHGFK